MMPVIAPLHSSFLPPELWDLILSKILGINIGHPSRKKVKKDYKLLHKLRLISNLFNNIILNNKNLYFTLNLMGFYQIRDEEINSPLEIFSIIYYEDDFKGDYIFFDEDVVLEYYKWIVKKFKIDTSNIKKRRNIIDALLKAFEEDHLEPFKYLIETFNITLMKLRNSRIYDGNSFFLYEIFSSGNLKFCKYLTDRLLSAIKNDDFSMEKLDLDLDKILSDLCICGSLDAVRWLIETFKLTSDHIDCKSLLWYIGLSNTNLEDYNWIVNRLQLTTENATDDDNFNLKTLCRHGNLKSLRRLINTFKITVEDIRSNDNYALRHAAGYGHLEVVKFLINTFNLTLEDIRSKNNHALLYSFRYRHLEVTKWLIRTFNLTIDDIRSNNNWVLQDFYLHKRLDDFTWLVNTFKLTIEDARSNDYWFIRYICNYEKGPTEYDGEPGSDLCEKFFYECLEIYGPDDSMYDNYRVKMNQTSRLKVLKWLINTFKLTVDDIRCHNNLLIKTLCKDEDLEALRWLIKVFPLTMEDFKSNDNEALKNICKKGYFELYDFLMDTFNIPSEDREFSASFRIARAINKGRNSQKGNICKQKKKKSRKGGNKRYIMPISPPI